MENTNASRLAAIPDHGKDALLAILATGVTMREAASLLQEAIGPLAAADALATRLTEDPIGTMRGLAALARSGAFGRTGFDPLLERLETWGLHPLSVAIALDDRNTVAVKTLAAQLGVARAMLLWVRPGEELNRSNDYPWPMTLRILPCHVYFPAKSDFQLPPGTVVQNLTVHSEAPFTLPPGLTVRENLNLAYAKGWDEATPEGLTVGHRFYTDVFPAHKMYLDPSRQDVRAGLSVEGWRRYKAFEAQEVAKGRSLLAVRTEGQDRFWDWLAP
jgi:hypothetical protein